MKPQNTLKVILPGSTPIILLGSLPQSSSPLFGVGGGSLSLSQEPDPRSRSFWPRVRPFAPCLTELPMHTTLTAAIGRRRSAIILKCSAVSLVSHGRNVLLSGNLLRVKMPLGTEVGLGPGHIVLDRKSDPQKRGTAPQSSAHVCCGQTAGWIKLPFGTEVGLGLGNIVQNYNPIIFLAILPTLQTLSSNRHFALLSSPVMLYIISERELTLIQVRYMLSPVRPSVCLSVCNVRAPYSGGSNFRQYFYGNWYPSHPLTSTENFTENVPGEPLRRGS